MDTLEYDHNVFSQQQAEGDKLLAVRFFMAPLKNEVRSAEEGRPIFDDTEMIEIRVRGDRNNIVIHPVRPDEKQRFRRAYEDFRAGRNGEISGTPLAEWPAMSASTVEEMRYLGFLTVEQLAEANDSVCGKIPGLITLRNKAKMFLEFAKGAAPMERMDKEIQDLKAQLDAQRRQNEASAAQFAELMAKHQRLLEKVAEEA